MTLFEILEKYMGIFLTVHLKDTRIEENLLQPKQADARYVYITTVSSLRLFSTLLVQFKLVYGPFGQSNMHSTLDICQTSQEGNECTTE